VNTSDTPWATDVPLRRRQSLDYVLVDLFRAGGTTTRSGAININTQQQYLPAAGVTTTLPLVSLLVGVRVGRPGATSPSQALTQATSSSAASTPSPADRISAGVNLLVNSTTVPASSGTGSNP